MVSRVRCVTSVPQWSDPPTESRERTIVNPGRQRPMPEKPSISVSLKRISSLAAGLRLRARGKQRNGHQTGRRRKEEAHPDGGVCGHCRGGGRGGELAAVQTPAGGAQGGAGR